MCISNSIHYFILLILGLRYANSHCINNYFEFKHTPYSTGRWYMICVSIALMSGTFEMNRKLTHLGINDLY